jgi:hypothetical protein
MRAHAGLTSTPGKLTPSSFPPVRYPLHSHSLLTTPSAPNPISYPFTLPALYLPIVEHQLLHMTPDTSPSHDNASAKYTVSRAGSVCRNPISTSSFPAFIFSTSTKTNTPTIIVKIPMKRQAKTASPWFTVLSPLQPPSAPPAPAEPSAYSPFQRC